VTALVCGPSTALRQGAAVNQHPKSLYQSDPSGLKALGRSLSCGWDRGKLQLLISDFGPRCVQAGLTLEREPDGEDPEGK
jgi:hypothetical protein